MVFDDNIENPFFGDKNASVGAIEVVNLNEMDSSALIELNNCNIYQGETLVLKDINLKIQKESLSNWKNEVEKAAY